MLSVNSIPGYINYILIACIDIGLAVYAYKKHRADQNTWSPTMMFIVILEWQLACVYMPVFMQTTTAIDMAWMLVASWKKKPVQVMCSVAIVYLFIIIAAIYYCVS